MNAVLERLRAARDEQVAAMDAVLAQVGDERDLVDAERTLLEACRDRINEIDAQIAPLAEFEALRGQHVERVGELPRPGTPAEPRRMDAAERGCEYASAGEFLVDYLRAHGMLEARGGRDDAAMARVQSAYAVRANQTTADTPGILPTPIVGSVVNLIDANRPLITSLGGAKPLGNIPGTTFTRPKVTRHVLVGPQAGEKTALPSQAMTIGNVPFTKKTYGGSVDISRQDIDWTSPAAWDILVRDLADVYAIYTETTCATDFATAATGANVPVTDDSLAAWMDGLYTAAMRSYRAGKRMPDRVWCSLDVWARLGALVDVARPVFPPNTTDEMNVPGTASLADFRGDILGLPRIVVPTFPGGTCIVGPSALFEAYEEVIGLLSVIEPSILGVEVAYGGYACWGTLEGTAFVPLDLTGVTLPVLADDDTLAVSNGNGGNGEKAGEKAGK
jgi:HK97 family phage major capsid protein